MRKIHKITNIALIFTLTGMFLCQGVAHGLRVPVGLDVKKTQAVIEHLDGKKNITPDELFKKKSINRLSGDEVEKVLLEKLYLEVPDMKRGSVVAGGKVYNYSYEEGEQRGFYRAGDIFVINDKLAYRIPEEVKNAGVKLVYLNFYSSIAGFEHKEFTILHLIGLQSVDLKEKTVLDAGAGNGIIGFASILLGAKKVYVLDRDYRSKDFIIECAEKNNIEIDEKFDFSYFSFTFKQLAETQKGKEVDVVSLNVPFWGILKDKTTSHWMESVNQLSDLLSVFPCKTVLLSGNRYNSFAEEHKGFSKYPNVNPEMDTEVKDFIMKYFLKPMGLELTEAIESSDPKGTRASFILKVNKASRTSKTNRKSRKATVIEKTQSLLREDLHINLEKAASELGYNSRSALSLALTRAGKPWREIKREALEARNTEPRKALMVSENLASMGTGVVEIGRPTTKTFTVLLVEDNPTERKKYTQKLLNKGYSVIAKENPSQAMEFLLDPTQKLPSVILTDYDMPTKGRLFANNVIEKGIEVPMAGHTKNEHIMWSICKTPSGKRLFIWQNKYAGDGLTEVDKLYTEYVTKVYSQQTLSNKVTSRDHLTHL